MTLGAAAIDETGPAAAAGRLEARGLSVHFEGVRAVDGIDLDLARGEILGLIGPNGAGKTTLVNALTGFQRPTAGRVALEGRDVTRLSPQRRTREGLARTFQAVRLFPCLTVLENVQAAASATGMTSRAARTFAYELLDRLGLPEFASLQARGIPAGMERRLGIVRALATRPSFLLLDEPAAGLNEQESDELVQSLTLIRDDFSCGLMVIEHDMRVIMRLCERIQVLDHGRTISVGTPAEVRNDPSVLVAYLGRRAVDVGDH
jgi:ABC-type branched-subunit amino acid transport system ATPase component